MEELLNKFCECFAPWKKDIEECEQLDEGTIQVWLRTGKSYIFGMRQNGQELFLESRPYVRPAQKEQKL